MRYEVDVLEQRPVTWLIEADDEAQAREKALRGRGREKLMVEYVSGEVVDVRKVAATDSPPPAAAAPP